MIQTTVANNKVVEFGFGTVKITSAYIDEKGILALNSNVEMPIGSSVPLNADGTKTDAQLIAEAVLSEVILEFDNVKSLEVLILKLQEVRAMMLGCDMSRIENWKRNNNITAVYQPNVMIDGIISNVDGIVKDHFTTDVIGVIFDGDELIDRRTNREVHEDAAGMGLDNSYFASQGIDPDEEYHKTRSHNAAKALEKCDK